MLEREPEIHARLMENVAYLTAGFRRLGFDAHGDSAIIALPVPVSMDIRAMAFAFHARGFFLNHIEYPAVKATQQRFRVSVMARHTREDLDALLEATEAVWAEYAPTGDGAVASGTVEVRSEEETPVSPSYFSLPTSPFLLLLSSHASPPGGWKVNCGAWLGSPMVPYCAS